MFLRQVDDAVRDARSRPEWREDYMRFDIRLMEKYAEGRSEGLAEGLDVAKERNKRLVAALRESGRLDELAGALEDGEVYERLLDEFGISFDG